jgi:hypothetical protein
MRASSDRNHFTNRDVIVKKNRPMSAIREGMKFHIYVSSYFAILLAIMFIFDLDIGAHRTLSKCGHRPATARQNMTRYQSQPAIKIRPTSPITIEALKPGLKLTNLYSVQKLNRGKVKETTSTFWDEGFSFNNKTIGSQASIERSNSPERLPKRK